MDGVVPLAMEFVTGDAEAGHLLIGYDNSLWIGARVEFAADGKPGLCCGGADEIDDHTIADQRLRLQFIETNENRRCSTLFHCVPCQGALMSWVQIPPGNSRSSRKHPGRMGRRRWF